MIRILKIKLIAINMILISIVLLITFVFAYEYTQKQIIEDTNFILEDLMINKNKIIPPSKEIGGVNSELDRKDIPPHLYFPVIIVELDANNNILNFDKNNILIQDQIVLNEMIQVSLDSDSPSGILPDENFRYLVKKTEFGTKIAFTDCTNEINQLNSLVKTFMLVGAGSLTFFFLISLFLARWAVKPIAKSLEQQRQFIADASHELKTPLTVILANTNILLTNKEKRIFEQQKWIDYIKIEVERMNFLVNNLLFLAKVDANKYNTLFTKINLSDLIWSSILPFESVAYEQEKFISSDIEDNIYIYGEEEKLKQLINILLDNAIKYSNSKGYINISLNQTHDKVKLSVNNTGEIISAEEINHIFERFYRVDKARTRNEGGYGLGLAIAKRIASSHHSKINVTSSKEDGTTFSITFSKLKGI